VIVSYLQIKELWRSRFQNTQKSNKALQALITNNRCQVWLAL